MLHLYVQRRHHSLPHLPQGSLLQACLVPQDLYPGITGLHATCNIVSLISLRYSYVVPRTANFKIQSLIFAIVCGNQLQMSCHNKYYYESFDYGN